MSRTYLALGVVALGIGVAVAGCSAGGADEPVRNDTTWRGGSTHAGGTTLSNAGSAPGSGPAGSNHGGGGAEPSSGPLPGADGGATGESNGGASPLPQAGMGTTSPGGSAMGGAGGASTPPGESAPVLPPVEGTCPAFKTGTVTVNGLGGISLEVGDKSANAGGSLIFYWHGTGSTAAEYKAMMPAAVRSEVLGGGGIIVSFQSSLGTGGDCSGTATFSKDDFKVADLLAACAVRDHGIDPRRIYTTGCSAGGLQAGCMAELRSSYIAAAVPNSGGTVFPQTFQSKTHTPAAMTMHGGAADRVIVAFSETSATFDKSIKAAGGFVVNCNHGGGHCGAPAPLYSAGWQFMKDHPFGISPEPYQSSLPSTFPSYCAKY